MIAEVVIKNVKFDEKVLVKNVKINENRGHEAFFNKRAPFLEK